MIVKKICAGKVRPSAKSKAAHIRDLTNYIRAPGNVEKLQYFSTRGFLSESFNAQQAEMIALATEAVRSPNPVTHWILSWREGEHPTNVQIDEAVDLFLTTLGLTSHQAIAGVHQDTNNLHVHVAVNRVHPERLKVVKPNKGFDLEAAHRAIALIEHTQGWQPEANARYSRDPNGNIERANQTLRAPAPSSRALDLETATGEKSAQRLVQEVAAGLISRAQSWYAVHELLAAAGMRYQRKGSGGLILVGNVAVKASSDRRCSLPLLEKRLGSFEPAVPSLVVTHRETEPTKAASARRKLWVAYTAARTNDKAMRDVRHAKLKTRHAAERQALLSEYRLIRSERLLGDWRGKGVARNITVSLIAAEKARALATLREKHTQERLANRRSEQFPSFEQWLSVESGPDAATAWRYRYADGFNHLSGAKFESPHVRDIRDFTPTVVGRCVRYVSTKSGAISFVDRGREILMVSVDSTATLAALQLAASKWGCVQIHGTSEFKGLCVRLAAKHGIRLANSDLRSEVEALRAARNGAPQHIDDESATHAVCPERVGQLGAEQGSLPYKQNPVSDQRLMELLQKRDAPAAKAGMTLKPTNAEAREQWKRQQLKAEIRTVKAEPWPKRDDPERVPTPSGPSLS